MAQGNSSTGKQGICLATLTLLALLVHAITAAPAPLPEVENSNGEKLPELEVTGMRYYIRKHSRLAIGEWSVSQVC